MKPSTVIVAGTGPAGLVAALAASGAGHAVELVGPLPREDDQRTTALMAPALEFLDLVGVRQALERDGAPLRVMRIVDGTRRLVRSPTATFRSSEIGEDAFGLNVPNAKLNRILVDAVEASPVTWTKALVERWDLAGDGARATVGDRVIEGSLVVAADGRASPAREAAGIRVSTRDWRQSALVVNFAHTRPHADMSTELHTETGPFTQVPLPGDRSSLVWVVRPETAAELAASPADDLSRRIEERMQSMLGRVTVMAGRQLYPLSAVTALSHAANRVALVGEAAHVFPPIGAQGLNLGIRDVADLIATMETHADDPGSAAALSAYASKRRPDILARTAAVSLLNMSLLSDMLPAQVARSAGLGLLSAVSPLRAFFMREGMRPGSGFRSAASAAREKVGRQDA
ncbi:MAG: UbiH/UbiF family hydroxylase [Rhizobiaceae bacterium]